MATKQDMTPYGAEELDLQRLRPGCLSVSKDTGFTLLVLEIKRRTPFNVYTICFVPIDGDIREITFRASILSWVVYPE